MRVWYGFPCQICIGQLVNKELKLLARSVIDCGYWEENGHGASPTVVRAGHHRHCRRCGAWHRVAINRGQHEAARRCLHRTASDDAGTDHLLLGSPWPDT